MSIRSTGIRFGIFAVVMVVVLAILVVVFGQFRFGESTAYRAEFTSASGVRPGDKVRIAGVDVGRVSTVEVTDDEYATVAFSVDSSVDLNGGTRALIRYQNLIGDRYLELAQGPGDPNSLHAGSVIPRSRTSPALDLDALVGGFRPLLKALDPEEVNGISDALVKVLQGESGTVAQVLRQTGEAAATLADQDALIGAVIENLNGVLATVNRENAEFDRGVDNLAQLVSGLAARSEKVADSVAGISRASRSVASLLDQTRPDIVADVAATRQVAANVNSDEAYVDKLLGELPESYRTLSRLGLYGAFFTFYLCDATLKLNGPKGDPVYVDIIGQRAGRCAPL